MCSINLTRALNSKAPIDIKKFAGTKGLYVNGTRMVEICMCIYVYRHSIIICTNYVYIWYVCMRTYQSRKGYREKMRGDCEKEGGRKRRRQKKIKMWIGQGEMQRSDRDRANRETGKRGWQGRQRT